MKIRGEKHRRVFFYGDMVEIGVFSDNPPDKCYGRVLKVERVRGLSAEFLLTAVMAAIVQNLLGGNLDSTTTAKVNYATPLLH